jgi:hypothetical protein
MTANELVDNLRIMGPQDAAVIFNYLAEHAHEARLANGCGLRDATDVIEWLRELAQASGCVERAMNGWRDLT